MTVDDQDVLRLIVFSGLDPANIYRETGLQPEHFMPHAHQAYFWNHAMSDLFIPEHPVALKDAFNGRSEFNFNWNTKLLKAMKAVLKTKPVQGVLEEIAESNRN